MSWTNLPFGGGIVTDLDTGLIYGIEDIEESPEMYKGNLDVPWKFTEFNPANKSFTNVEKRGRPYSMNWVSMVYSSAAKRIFGYEDGLHNDQATLWSYNTTSKDWTLVNVTGDIPPTRSLPCLVSAYSGKKLILAGGLGIKEPAAVLNDVYSFDVSTLAWTKLPNMPLAVWSQSCAVSGDSFIFMGGFTSPSIFDYDGENPVNNEGPAILNLTSNTWGTRYTPPGQTPSSADRTHLTLSKAGFAALAVISAAASSLITL
ncbi:hypothetical protein BGZ65_002255 [Modicella reniformis]|uniref:Kelch repeat-containing protein n=1 Tax=Modicella reniformis TaxID=1440133 RepID=A0A9P6MJB0_9FUNG|nr:hypothetical protein BGZ65_002255 [Modicella reniformis]